MTCHQRESTYTHIIIHAVLCVPTADQIIKTACMQGGAMQLGLCTEDDSANGRLISADDLSAFAAWLSGNKELLALHSMLGSFYSAEQAVNSNKYNSTESST